MGFFSRNNLSEIKDGAYIINIDEFKSIGTHWIALYVNGTNVTYFDSFGVEHIPKEIKKFIPHKNITNIYIIQAHDTIMSHREIICSWNIRGTFPWYIPRIFGKSSLWNYGEY